MNKPILLGSHDEIIINVHGTSVNLGGRICLLRDAPPKIRHMSLGRLSRDQQLALTSADFQHGKSNASYVNTGEVPLRLGARVSLEPPFLFLASMIVVLL
jgi:hypothetical protein